MIQRLAPMAVLAGLLIGCGGGATDADYGSLGLVSASGTVTLDGSPLAGATVQFEADDQTYSVGATDSNGYYSLQFNSEKSGVIPGRKTVRITTSSGGDSDDSSDGASEKDSDSPAAGDAAKEASTAVPACYNRESKLTVEVTSSGTTFNFDLKSDCSTTGAK